MLPDITSLDLSTALDECVARLLLRGGTEKPPVNAVKLAHALGIAIAWDSSQTGRARIVRHAAGQGGPARHSILLRPDPRPERRQWAVSHEIGEATAHEVFATLGVDAATAPAGTREWVANLLAARILLPQVLFHSDALALQWDLLELKARYSTASHELIARRMLDFEPAVVITIYDQARITFRQSNQTGQCAAPLREEIACWRAVHESSRPAKRSAAGRQVLGWPIHEQAWKRDILRLEFEDNMFD